MPARWRAVEDHELRRLYTAGEPLAVIAAQLGRSDDAIGARRVALDLPARRRPPAWSPLADRVLREAVAAGLPATVIAHKLRRPVGEVRARRRQLGLARPAPRRYSASEDAAIRTAWAAGEPVEDIARDLARTADAIRLRTRALGLHAPPMRRRWNTVEDDVVREGYSDGLTCEAIARALPGRTPAGERALVQREIQARGDRAVVSLERRLNRTTTALRAAVASRRAS